jgi:hypothetical protein
MTSPTSGEIVAASLGWAAYGSQEQPPPEVAGLSTDDRDALWREASGVCQVVRDKLAEVKE